MHHLSCPGVPSPTLVIFDCDGVLVDSEPLSTHVLADALTAAGLPTSPSEAYERYRGKALSDIAADARDRSGSPLPDDFWQRFERDRASAFERSLRAVDGAAEAVRAVKAAGVAVCVASQGRRSKTELTLGLTGLRHLFADGTLFSAYDVCPRKAVSRPVPARGDRHELPTGHDGGRRGHDDRRPCRDRSRDARDRAHR